MWTLASWWLGAPLELQLQLVLHRLRLIWRNIKKFNELNFKRWQQKMVFYLTTLGLVRFFAKDPPSQEDGEQDNDCLAREKWHHSKYLCNHYVMNGLSNLLYDVYILYSDKSLQMNCWKCWCHKRWLLDYKMVNSKTVISQVQEFQLILHGI